MVGVKKVSYITDQGVGRLNEDQYTVNAKNGVYAVFDGASAIDGYLTDDDKTGAFLASETAAKLFSQDVSDLQKTILEANHAIDRLQTDHKIDKLDKLHRFCTTVAAVKLSANHIEIASLGDSVVLLFGNNGELLHKDPYHDHDQPIMRKWRKLADHGKTNIRQLINDDLYKLRRQSNISYGVLNGEDEAAKFIKYEKINACGAVLILLLTDGMFVPKKDPTVGENWGELYKIYKQGGLKKILKTVRKLENSDPDLLIYPRYKKHDDATGIAIELG